MSRARPTEEIFLQKTQQMGMNQGIKMFGGAGTAAVHKEMKHLHDRHISIPFDPYKLSRGDRCAALKYLMFLKQKHDGSRLGPAQDVHFFYTRSHLSGLQSCALIFSTNFQFIFTIK